ncbi:MAG: TonB-dependent receptor [Vicinamibacterales bacterium]
MNTLLALNLLFALAAPQQPVVVTVIDARTSAPVADALVQLRQVDADATVRQDDTDRSVQTDATGIARFGSVPEGRYLLTVSTIGYIFVRRTVQVSAKPVVVTVPMAEGTGTYQEAVTVGAETTPVRDPGVASQIELGSAALQDLRGIATDDPMRAMQTLPGVATGDDFQAEFSVRGSAFRHVGIMIDGVQAPLLMHAVRGRDDTGSLAMINGDLLDRASLLAGAHPLRHGDWLGATLEFGLRDGSRDRTQLRGAVSGTSASAVIEGPLTPRRTGSWLFSLRRSYVDWLIRKLDPEIDSTFGFSDAQGVLTIDLTSRQQIRLLILGGQSTYRERDAGISNGLAKAVSTGGLASVGWRRTGDSTLLSQRFSASNSTFTNTGVRGQNLGEGSNTSHSWRGDALKTVGHWAIEAGARYERMHQNLALRRFSTTSTGGLRVTASRDTQAATTIGSVWGQVTRRASMGSVTFGARGSRDRNSGDAWVSPWLLTEYSRGRVTVRASAGASHQRPSLDLMSAASEPLRLESARQADVSAVVRLSGASHLQVTPFLREERDILRPVGEDRAVNGTRVAGTVFPTLSSRLDGRTKGIDLLLQRRAARGLTGWIAYTWAHTTHDDKISGERFDSDFDQRHTINVFLLQRLSYRSTVSAKFRLGSNVPLAGYFTGSTDALKLSDIRNQVRLPWYARLDLRANRTFTFSRRRLTLFAEVLNVLGRRNLGQADGFSRTSLEAVFFTEKLIPRVPSAGFVIEF